MVTYRSCIVTVGPKLYKVHMDGTVEADVALKSGRGTWRRLRNQLGQLATEARRKAGPSQFE
jgi:hypothetical protein